MTRPDSRLLLPASAVARVPYGARVWDKIDRYGVVAGIGRHLAEGPTLSVCWSDWPRSTVPAKHVLVDLSAPTNGDRLDALPWALGVLRPRSVPTLGGVLGSDNRITTAVIGGSIANGAITPDMLGAAWPDLSGLTPGEQARAVVVAALVARAGVTP